MHMSRHLEETPKTKFRNGREDEYKKTGKKNKLKVDRLPRTRRDYDSVEEDESNGC